jgi:hypothetical protein
VGWKRGSNWWFVFWWAAPRSVRASGAQYRAALDAGAEPATVARWITETEAERARYKAAKRAAMPRPAATSMSRDEIASIVSTLADVLAVLRDADPADKAEIYTQLGYDGFVRLAPPGRLHLAPPGDRMTPSSGPTQAQRRTR